MTIVLAVIIFNFQLNPTNLLGITLTLAGGACESAAHSPLRFGPRLTPLSVCSGYARVELQEKTARAAAAAKSPAPPPVAVETKLG